MSEYTMKVGGSFSKGKNVTELTDKQLKWYAEECRCEEDKEAAKEELRKRTETPTEPAAPLDPETHYVQSNTGAWQTKKNWEQMTEEQRDQFMKWGLYI